MVKNSLVSKFCLIGGAVVGVFALLFALLQSGISAALFWLHALVAAALILTGIFFHFKSSKALSYRSFSLSFLKVIVIAIVLLSSYGLIAKQNIFWDLSAARVYSLGYASQNILSNLEKPLKLFVLDDKNPVTRKAVRDLLELYSKANSNISYSFLNPEIAKRVRSYINPAEKNIIYLEYGEKEQAIVGQLKKFSEVEISKAIYRMTKGAGGRIYYVFGHGEPNGDDDSDAGFSELTQALIEQNFEFRGFYLNSAKTIPADARLLIMAAGKTAYTAEEQKVLTEYYKRGGNLLILGDPEGQKFDFLLKQMSLQFDNSVVLDNAHSLQGSSEVGWQLLLNDLRPHAVSNSIMAKKLPVVFLLASPIKILDPSSKFQPILYSSKTAWAEKDLTNLFSSNPTATFDAQADTQGPLVMGGVLEQENATKGDSQKVAVYSDLEWLRNANLGVYANNELFINTVNWLVAEKDIEVLPRLITPSRLEPITKSSYQILLVIACLLPEACLLLLLTFWYRRRKG